MAKFIAVHELAVIPTRATEFSAGYDLSSCEQLSIAPGCTGVVNTGIKFVILDREIRRLFYFRIAPRSGISLRSGVMINAGVVDSDYEGEIKVIIQNTSERVFFIREKDKIAQLIPEQLFPVAVEGEKVVNKQRGTDGFGSSD
jgi:dUTP pyrophosphatase